MNIKSEKLAYWYLRLNGFLTIENFIVHPDDRGCQRTDVDILGVRFPNRSELFYYPMEDDNRLLSLSNKTLFILAEVKKGIF